MVEKNPADGQAPSPFELELDPDFIASSVQTMAVNTVNSLLPSITAAYLRQSVRQYLDGTRYTLAPAFQDYLKGISQTALADALRSDDPRNIELAIDSAKAQDMQATQMIFSKPLRKFLLV
jgi:hypothetical protein